MIDTKELRRLAQAATPHVGHACKYQDAHWLREGHVDFENADLFIASERPQEDAAFYAAVNPAAINELLDRIETAEKEVESLRQEIALRDDVVAALAAPAVERDELRARIEAMEQQEPVGVLHVGSYYGEELQDWEFEANQCACDKLNEAYVRNPMSLPLYALPGAQAQPAPSVPDGVAEALQRLIENGAVLGPSSSEDALLVARYRQHLLSSAPSISPAALRPVIQWLRNGCDPMKAAKELEILIVATPEAKP